MKNVSRETYEKFERYQELLRKWQRAINLVSPQTLADLWGRHFADSLQLAALIPENAVLADIGSGAGFPGLVLALARPDLTVHLIEADEKKCQFLRTVSREIATPVHIHTARIEESYGLVRPDIVTARALKNLKQLCFYCLPWAARNPDLTMLFLKGEKAESEREEALRAFDFLCESHPSKTCPEGRILRLSGLKDRPVTG